MQLLKAYLFSHDIPFPIGSIPPGGVAFLLRNTSWVLPWLWHHREVDEEFVVAVVGFPRARTFVPQLLTKARL